MAEPDPRPCACPGCDDVAVPQGYYCAWHWRSLTDAARRGLASLYRPGQLVDGRCSEGWERMMALARCYLTKLPGR